MKEKMMHSAILFLLVLSASRDVQCDNLQEQVEELFQNYYKWKLGTDRFLSSFCNISKQS
jgi:hypothetical protein